MITIYTFAFNEELMLPFMIDFYRERFPDCKIVVFDNESTDNTAKIALDKNCQVMPYLTNNQIIDTKLRDTKNNCWKDAETEWVLICDCDELLNINQDDLKMWQERGASIIPSKGFNMVNMANSIDLKSITNGFRAPDYDKCLLFNKWKIREINYACGAHSCKPEGDVKASPAYNMYHYRFVNPDYMVNKYAEYNKRLCAENILKRYGAEYRNSENEIRTNFKEARRKSFQVIYQW